VRRHAPIPANTQQYRKRLICLAYEAVAVPS
jgi:hypothetical protein